MGWACHRHHSDPKFMRGDKKQKLTTLDEQTYRELHKDLNDFLVKKLVMLMAKTSICGHSVEIVVKLLGPELNIKKWRKISLINIRIYNNE